MQRKRRKRKRHHVANRHLERAWELVEKGELEAALREAGTARAIADDSPAVWCDYGRILALTGELTKAEKALRNAILIAPDYTESYVHLAEVLSAKGLTIEAYRHAREAVRRRPTVPLHRELLERYRARLPEDWQGDLED